MYRVSDFQFLQNMANISDSRFVSHSVAISYTWILLIDDSTFIADYPTESIRGCETTRREHSTPRHSNIAKNLFLNTNQPAHTRYTLSHSQGEHAEG